VGAPVFDDHDHYGVWRLVLQGEEGVFDPLFEFGKSGRVLQRIRSKCPGRGTAGPCRCWIALLDRLVATTAEPEAWAREANAERPFHQRLQCRVRQEFQMLPNSDSRLI
jgi:hypothetical protein